MANQIVEVLNSVIETINDNAEESLDRDRQIAEAIKLVYGEIKSLKAIVEKLVAEQNKPAEATDIPESDAANLKAKLGKKSAAPKKAAKSEAPAPKPEPTPAPAPQPEPEEVEEDESEEEVDEEEEVEEEALDNDANPEEIKSIFQSKSTGRQRIVCMTYLKAADRKSECRLPDKLTWDYCSTIKKDESSSKSAMEQWLEFVVAYEQSNG